MQRKKAATGRRVSYYKKKFFFSIRERILLHLSEYNIYENELEVPDELTQFGIADVVLAGRSTCSKLLQEMEDRGLLYGRRAHVPSGKIRRTVYFLTPRGHIEASKVRKKVEETVVKVRTPSGELKKLRVVHVPKEVPVYAPLVDVVCHISRGIFDVENFVDRMKARRERVAYLGSMPRLRHFFDRGKEEEDISRWLNSKTHRLLVIHGLPGVGKTTLAGRVVTNLRDEMSVFWYRFHEWSTLRNVLRQMGEFMARLNKKDLVMYLETHEVLDMEEVFFLLEKNMKDLKAVMVFDDYDKAGGRLNGFFSTIKEMLERLNGTKVIVISRTVPKFYDRRDVRVKKLVEELPLEGLDREGTATLLTLKNIPETEFDRIYAKTKGHPLFLELVQGSEVSDTKDIDKFLEEELFSRLLDVERRVLSLASVFRKPVHVDALFLDDDVDYVVITSLSDQSLLKESTPKVFDVHDLVKSFFYSRLTPAKRKRYHMWAAKFYTSRGAPG
ncbi:MAG: ATP-binding protein, partial [Thermoplasmata archaeon]